MRIPALLLLATAVMSASLAACAVPRIPYTDAEARDADVGIPLARSWADRPDPAFERNTNAVIAAARREGRRPTYLSLSGGGGDGAYGAGILNGWTQSGRRPVFTVVSGVSTGALTAPFAFLGPRYDDTLREIYTSGEAQSLLAEPDPLLAVTGASIFSDERFRQLVTRYVTPDFVAEIAAESRRGRLLFVLTTNLDSQRPVLWNMGAIAAAGGDRAVSLFRDVLIASASIPAVFPPVLIDAEADGRRFQEMHVDGSISSNVYTLPRTYLSGEANRSAIRGGVVYILLNTSPKPKFEVVANRTLPVVGRTVSLAFKEQTQADLDGAFRAAKRDGFDLNLTYLDPKEQTPIATGFDTVAMRRLYDLGEHRGRTGTFWEKDLRGFEPEAGRLAMEQAR